MIKPEYQRLRTIKSENCKLRMSFNGCYWGMIPIVTNRCGARRPSQCFCFFIIVLSVNGFIIFAGWYSWCCFKLNLDQILGDKGAYSCFQPVHYSVNQYIWMIIAFNYFRASGSVSRIGQNTCMLMIFSVLEGFIRECEGVGVGRGTSLWKKVLLTS